MIIPLIRKKLTEAQQAGHILESAYQNCITWLDADLFEEWVIESMMELVAGSHWAEINDRFYRTLAFGTGGIRGRTIGRVVTNAERGSRSVQDCPERPAVGSNCMNDFNVRRATMGLINYLQSISESETPPHVIFAHDTRHFSRHFALLGAKTVIECGGQASLFESERSTPELSFAVRYLGAHGGVVITASHNPPHDNGFKAYFNDGAQVVEPHASSIIRQVQAVSIQEVCQRRSVEQEPHSIGKEIDQAYANRLRTLVLEPEVVRKLGATVKIIYSPLHGTGVKMVPWLLEEIGFQIHTVKEQANADGQFSTVKSPNPENAEALSLSIQLAEKENADLVMATDPDADRMGVAVRNVAGKMELLNGNQIGSLLAHYRLDRLVAQSVLTDSTRPNARLIKTVVTTDLQKAIAKKFGVMIPETLTGFKYIGEKLRKYESQLLQATGIKIDAYRKLSEEEKRKLLLKHSAYYVFGGEESYGYSASDFTRDKDANAACIMFAELAIFAKSKGQTILDYLDSIYSELGYYQEKLGQIVLEGAEGASKIQRILQSYEKTPPREIAGLKINRISNYAKEEIRDCEGDVLPKELLFFVELENGSRYAVRGSGTEPKIKFYLFAHEKPTLGKRFSNSELVAVKRKTAEFLNSLWQAIESDAKNRADDC